MSNHANDEQRHTDRVQKLEFARLMFEAGPTADAYNIAFEMFPQNPNRAVLVGGHWRADPVVIEELSRLRNEQKEVVNTLPTQNDLARTIWLKMQDCNDPDAFVKLAKLYAEVQGMIKKPSDPGSSGQQVRHVLAYTDHGDPSDWERKLVSNQNQLQEDGLKEIAAVRLED